MKHLILSITVLLSISAYAHRSEVNILDTDAGKVAALAKVGGETGRYIDRQKGLTILAKALVDVFYVENQHYREIVLATIANEYARAG